MCREMTVHGVQRPERWGLPSPAEGGPGQPTPQGPRPLAVPILATLTVPGCGVPAHLARGAFGVCARRRVCNGSRNIASSSSPGSGVFQGLEQHRALTL